MAEKEAAYANCTDRQDDLAELLVCVGRRDLEALRQLYSYTSGKLLSLCLRITGDRETAEDVLQEVYVKIWNRAGGYDPSRGRALGWLAAIARNSAIDAYRAQSRRITQDLAEVPESSDSAKAADEELIDQQLEQRAFSLVDDLSVVYKDHIREVFFEGLTYAELASRHGLPVNTIKSRIHRALTILNKRWDGG